MRRKAIKRTTFLFELPYLRGLFIFYLTGLKKSIWGHFSKRDGDTFAVTVLISDKGVPILE